MPRLPAIFEKDARHLWPQIAVFWSLLAAAAALDPLYTHRRPLPAEGLVWTALPLACWVLVMAVIHENRLPGDRQYWLTRPYTRGGLVASKALFVAIFVNLPLFLAHAAVMAALGIPPWRHLPALLWQQLFLTAFAILPAAAIATVTTGLKQVILAALAIVVPLFVATTGVSFLMRRALFFLNPGWSSGIWLKPVVTAAVLMAGAAAVIGLQYWRRATGWSRALAAAAALCALMAPGMVHKEQAFSLQTWLSGVGPRESAIHLAVDGGPGRTPAPLYSRERRVYGLAHVEIPVLLLAPPDAILLPDTETRVEAPGGRAFYTEVREQPYGRWWLSMDLPGGYFDSVKSAPLDLEGSLDVTLFHRGVLLPAPALGPVVVPGIGVCRSRLDFEGRWAVECYSPAPHAALALQFPGGGRHWIVSRSTADVPVPTPGEFETIQRFSSPTTFAARQDIAPLGLITELPVAHLRLHFRLPAIRLADFVFHEDSRDR